MTTTEFLARKYAEIFSREYNRGTSEACNALPRNIKGNEYSGCNIFFLRKYSRMKGFNIPVFLTFNQIKELGLSVLKGEQSCPVVYYECTYKDPDSGKRITESEYLSLDEDSRNKYIKRATIKYYNVFNVCQTNMKDVNHDMYSSIINETAERIGMTRRKRDAVIYCVDKVVDETPGIYPDRKAFIDKHEWYRKVFSIAASSSEHDADISPCLASHIVMAKMGFEDGIDSADVSYMKMLSSSPDDAFNAVTEAARLANNIIKTFNINC